MSLEQLIGHLGPHHKKEKMMITQETVFVGIDVGKFEFVVAMMGHARPGTYPNTPQGIADCLQDLDRLKRRAYIGMEPTGGYEWPLWEALDGARFHVRQLASVQVHAFAKLHGTLAKTDRLDAATIAAFFHHRPDAGRVLPARKLRRLRVLSAKRRQLIKTRKALDCQTKQHRDEDILAMDRALRNLICEQITGIEDAIESLLREDEALAAKAALLISIPGIGPVLTATLIGEMPELGSLSDKTVAALAGLAPMNRDSGKATGKRFIRGGRKTVRNVLYQAALVASVHNPELRPFAQRLKEKGKPHKLVMTAVCRKLIIIANAVVKRGTPWQIRDA